MTTGGTLSHSDISALPVVTPAPAGRPQAGLLCRGCGSTLTHTFVDLGTSPLCQNIVRTADLAHPEKFYPLHTFICGECLLVQLPAHVPGEEIFNENYAYFASYSVSWLAHARRYVDQMIERFHFGSESQVVEVASNDGYLLQYFVFRGIPSLGIEPASRCAEVAIAKGIPTLQKFFGAETARELAAEGKQADLLLGNNVLAHVPDLNDFVAGMRILLSPGGVITMEFPHLVRLIEGNQFDTIYHEHYSYFSLHAVRQVFQRHKLTIFHVEELPTHGGSLRIFARHAGNDALPIDDTVTSLAQREADSGYAALPGYSGFSEKVAAVKRSLLKLLIDLADDGRKVVGYGAPGKANTLLNYCGIRTDLLAYTVDRNPHKQQTYTPGTRIPIYEPDRIAQTRPDYVVILPWNLKHEIMAQLKFIREWGGQFIIPIPEVEIV